MEPFYIAFSQLLEDLLPASRVDAVLSTHLLVNYICAIIMPQPIGGGYQEMLESVRLSVCLSQAASSKAVHFRAKVTMEHYQEIPCWKSNSPEVAETGEGISFLGHCMAGDTSSTEWWFI